MRSCLVLFCFWLTNCNAVTGPLPLSRPSVESAIFMSQLGPLQQSNIQEIQALRGMINGNNATIQGLQNQNQDLQKKNQDLQTKLDQLAQQAKQAQVAAPVVPKSPTPAPPVADDQEDNLDLADDTDATSDWEDSSAKHIPIPIVLPVTGKGGAKIPVEIFDLVKKVRDGLNMALAKTPKQERIRAVGELKIMT